MVTTAAPQNKVLISKRILYGIILVTVVAGTIGVWFFLTRNNSNQANKVEITSFSKDPPIDQNNGYLYRFTVSVQNKGNNSLSGVTLLIRMLGNDETELVRTTREFSILSPSEGQTITAALYLRHGTVVDKTPFSYVITVKLGDLVLDEARVP